MRTLCTTALISVLGLATNPASAQVDWPEVGEILARPVSGQAGEVHRFGFPRTDLEVVLDGTNVMPGLALGTWLAFHPTDDDQVMVMGDLVLLEEEVNPVMKRLAEGGVEVTAIHNHLLRAQPFPMYMHVEAHGDPIELAKTFRDAIALSETPMNSPTANSAEQGLDFNSEIIAQVLEHEGSADGGVYKVSIPRAAPISEDGMALPAGMGAEIAINFQSAGGDEAATTGDFVLTADEVNPVLRALRDNDIEVTALHNHMLEEEPRLFFMHFWGVGAPEALARGLKSALDLVDVQ